MKALLSMSRTNGMRTRTDRGMVRQVTLFASVSKWVLPKDCVRSMPTTKVQRTMQISGFAIVRAVDGFSCPVRSLFAVDAENAPCLLKRMERAANAMNDMPSRAMMA